MITIYSDDHHLHHGNTELIGGLLQPCLETASRADAVLARIQLVGLGEVIAPEDFGLDPVYRVHRRDYVGFLAAAWDEWAGTGRSHDALPLVWPVHGLRNDRVPEDIDGKLGYYAMDAAAPITAGTWKAVQSSTNVALTGATLIADGQREAFALCRPPGHHAAAQYMGGYCYLNNTSIAAEHLLGRGAKRVAVLDVDYHHGNGTQSIFYSREDVLVANLHADPHIDYPYFLGYPDEKGEGAGVGCNFNYPLPAGTAWDTYSAALWDACRNIASYAPDAVILSLGVDTFERDPACRFRLRSDDYLRIGEAVGGLTEPVLFIMEGGYAVDDIGVNVANVLIGYESVRC